MATVIRAIMGRDTGWPMGRSKFACALALACICSLLPPPMHGQSQAEQAGGTVAEANAAIGAGDVLDVEVFDTPELSAESARVNQDGEVNLPVLGAVKVAGFTVAEAARKIES